MDVVIRVANGPGVAPDQLLAMEELPVTALGYGRTQHSEIRKRKNLLRMAQSRSDRRASEIFG
jgi:hypothetical protein